MLFRKREVKDMGLSPEQSQVIISNTYASDLLLDNNFNRIAKAGFKSNPDGFTVIDKLASAVAKLDFIVYELDSKGKKRYIDNHPFLNLIKRPNPDVGKFDYLYELVLFFVLSGQMFQRKILVGKEPKQLYVCKPSYMGMLLGKSMQTGWFFRYNGQDIKYELDEISYLKIPDPEDDFLGFSPLRAAAYNIDGNNENDKWNYSMLRNGARPSGILTSPNVIKDDLFERLKRQIQQMWSGGINAGKTQILDGGIQWQQLSLSAKDMDNINYSKLNSRKIAQVLGIPNELLGDAEAKTYNNYKEAKMAFYKDTVLALAQRIIDNWNTWLMPAWGEGQYIEVDKEKIEALKEDADALSARILSQYQSGLITKAEAREALGYPYDKKDDVYKIGFNDIFVQKGDDLSAIETIGTENANNGTNGTDSANNGTNGTKNANNSTNGTDSADNSGVFSEIKSGLNKVLIDLEEKAASDKSKITTICDTLDYIEYYDDVIDEYDEILKKEGDRTNKEVLKIDKPYVRTKSAVKYMEKQVLKKCKAIVNDTLKNKIGYSLQEGMSNNESALELKDRITTLFEEQYFKSKVPNHAMIIARTEALTATSVATNDAYTASGIEMKREWITIMDNNERESHATMNGQVKGLDEYFVSGDGVELKFPRDPACNVAGEVIQCRCSEAPVISTEKGDAPMFDTIEAKTAFWNKQNSVADSYVPNMLKAVDKAMRKQCDYILGAIDKTM